MEQASAKKLPIDITSYDLLKTLAVITMVIDHIGLYFFPDDMGWRVVGRMSMPIWLFLIGYAQTREITDYLWGGALVLVISSLVVGESVFTLNILVTIMIVRLLLDTLVRFALQNLQSMFLTILAMAVLILPTFMIFDYGTQAFLFALFGYLVRHQGKTGFARESILIYMGAIFLIYVVFQQISFGMNDNVEFYTMGAGVLLVCFLLSGFEARTYPKLTRQLPGFVTSALQLMGRRTLEIYVVHLLLFKVIGLWLFSERFPLFGWSWF